MLSVTLLLVKVKNWWIKDKILKKGIGKEAKAGFLKTHQKQIDNV